MKNNRMENHHPNFKSAQKKTIGNVYDDRTIPEEHDFHTEITNQVLYEGVPQITTVGEIDLDDIKKGRYPRVKDYKIR